MHHRFPGYRERAEWPVQMRRGSQLITGWIDSLWEGPEGYVIVDHKTFLGHEKLWDAKALAYAGQLQQYRHMLELAGPKPVLATWIHFPVMSRMIRIDLTGKR
jgi:ATP-dependent exoDNAse (exonuclease V) beta subunit